MDQKVCKVAMYGLMGKDTTRFSVYRYACIHKRNNG